MATAPAKKTASAKTTKAAAAAKPAKPALAAVPPSSADDEIKAAGAKSAVLRLRDLVNRVSENHGHKKKDVKDIVESMLAEMAKALDNKENMILPSLGKVRIVRQGDVDTGVPMTLKLRRSNAAGAGKNSQDKEGLADDGEDS